MTYKLYNDTEFGNLSGVIQTLDNGVKKFIPINEEMQIIKNTLYG
jgi:hypothetical protein